MMQVSVLRWGLLAVLVSLGIALGACGAEDKGVVGKELGVLKASPLIKGRDGGFSGMFQGVSVWLYGDTILSKAGEDGSSWRHNTWSWTAKLKSTPSISGFREDVDAKDAPRELFVLTKAEAIFNEDHKGEKCKVKPCGARFALWPGPVVELPNKQGALIFYTKIYGEPGEWNFHGLGQGIALWKDPKKPVTRKALRPGKEHPTLLFDKDEPNFGSSGALIKDGMVYAFGCEGKLAKPCRLGRVPVTKALSRDAWEYWSGTDWTKDIKQVGSLFEGTPMMTVHWSAYLKRYVAVYSKLFDTRLVLRTAKELVGPWSEEIVAFSCKKSHDGKDPYSGLGHPEFAREGGRYELATYFRSPGDWKGEIRVVELDLAALRQ